MTFGLKPRARGIFWLPMSPRRPVEITKRMAFDKLYIYGIDCIDGILYHRIEHQPTTHPLKEPAGYSNNVVDSEGRFGPPERTSAYD